MRCGGLRNWSGALARWGGVLLTAEGQLQAFARELHLFWSGKFSEQSCQTSFGSQGQFMIRFENAIEHRVAVFGDFILDGIKNTMPVVSDSEFLYDVEVEDFALALLDSQALQRLRFRKNGQQLISLRYL
jgi:hypothetical protein